MVDLAGNAACASVQFTSQGVAAVTGLEIQPPVFSPTNTMGRPTASLDFVRLDRRRRVDRRDSRLASAMRCQIAPGEVTAGETISLGWDGRDFDGDLVDDGAYGLWIRLVSDCGAIYETPEPLREITVDTEGPTVVVTNPWPGPSSESPSSFRP